MRTDSPVGVSVVGETELSQNRPIEIGILHLHEKKKKTAYVFFFTLEHSSVHVDRLPQLPSWCLFLNQNANQYHHRLRDRLQHGRKLN